MPVNLQPDQTSNIFFKTRVSALSAVWRWNFRCLYFHPVVNSWIAEDSFTFLLYIQVYGGTWYNTLLLPVIAYCPCNLQEISTFSELRHPLDLAATPWAVPSQTWILYSRVAPASAVEEIIHWNNPPNREASGLVRKGVGQWVIFRAVATPVPAVYPIPSHPIIKTRAISMKS